MQVPASGLRSLVGGVPPFVLHTMPYVVRVVCPHGTGTGTVIQYRCGAGGVYVSEEWWLVTSTHVVCQTGTTLVAEGYVEFFYEWGARPVRVDLDVATCRVLSPPPHDPGYPIEESTLELAILRCVWGHG